MFGFLLVLRAPNCSMWYIIICKEKPQWWLTGMVAKKHKEWGKVPPALNLLWFGTRPCDIPKIWSCSKAIIGARIPTYDDEIAIRFGGVDLAFRFKILPGKVSKILITWVILLSKELSVLIIWPSKQQIKSTLPTSFRK